MDFFNASHTSSSGLSAQRLRMNLISSNLANIHTTRTPQGGPYKRKDAIFEAKPVAQSFKDVLRSRGAKGVSEVKVAEIIEDPAPAIMKYDPNHPDADEKGYVAMPNINLMEEMVNMITAARSYEANVAAVKASKSMALKALDIGK
jgi:flagellar basal-body rod protein FlgC